MQESVKSDDKQRNSLFPASSWGLAFPEEAGHVCYKIQYVGADLYYSTEGPSAEAKVDKNSNNSISY